MRAYYTDYINHMLKTYAHHPLEELRNEVDRTNWQTCDAVLQNFPVEDVQIIKGIYGLMSYKAPRPLTTLVTDYCEQSGQEFEYAMNVVRRVTKQIKKERGL